MNSDRTQLVLILQYLTPVILLCAIAVFFFMLSARVSRTNKNRYRRQQALTGSSLNAVTGSVGGDVADGVAAEVERGKCSDETDGVVTIARQGRIPNDTIASLL